MKIMGRTKNGFIISATDDEVYALLGSYVKRVGMGGSERATLDPWTTLPEVGTSIDVVEMLKQAREMRKAKNDLRMAPSTLRALADVIARECEAVTDGGE